MQAAKTCYCPRVRPIGEVPRLLSLVGHLYKPKSKATQIGKTEKNRTE
jgi:hypothetical protein